MDADGVDEVSQKPVGSGPVGGFTDQSAGDSRVGGEVFHEDAEFPPGETVVVVVPQIGDVELVVAVEVGLERVVVFGDEP